MTQPPWPPPQQMPPPGWYPDPSGGAGQKYWDGYAWHTAVPKRPGPEAVKVKMKTNWVPLGIIIGLVLAVVVAVGIIGGRKTNESRSSTSTTSSRAETADDTAFLAKLDAMDIPYTSRHDATLKGRAVCLFLDVNENADFADAAREVRDTGFLNSNSNLSDADATIKALGFVGAATAVYCPQHKPR